ncbi:MAG: alpha/beta hydrolase [Chrysiogenetes bacterium]|nr:alpha/beta hydrolase [Chrysiogenetes bacterium]
MRLIPSFTGSNTPAPRLPKKFVQTSYGRIAYLERGKAGTPPILFVHGIPTSSYLWRSVIDALSDRFHCYAPDLMGLGDTEVDVPNTPFNMGSQAENLAEFMSALGHEKFALVCHDQGGAAAQVLVARHPERITAFCITNCVCYDNWPVPLIAATQKMAKVPFLSDAVSRSGIGLKLQTHPKLSQFRRGVYKGENLTDESIVEYLRPTLTKDGSARFRAFLLAGDSKYSQDAVAGLRKFNKPTHVIWATDDRFLSVGWGERLMNDIPGAKSMEIVPFCGHFWQEERPTEFAEKMGTFFEKVLLKPAAKPTPASKKNAAGKKRPAAKKKQAKATRKRARARA